MQIEKELFEKFKYITQHEGRSVNRDLIRYMRIRLKTYEDEHGEITLNIIMLKN